jgi:hypothetical protein
MDELSDIIIKIKDINELYSSEVTMIYDQLSREDSISDSSIRKELDKRYINIIKENHPKMSLAMVWFEDVLVGWVGTRDWVERSGGELIPVQTIECFVNSKFRRMGVVKLGLQSLITALRIDKLKVVSVYALEVISIAKQCGFKNVLHCEPDGR